MDPLIVGGGPAGCAAAIALARAGAAPLVLEQSRAAGDGVCGGFLSWRTCEALAGIGVEVEALGGKVVRNLRLVAADTSTLMRLPRPGIGLSRRRLDEELLCLAASAGARIERGTRVARVDGDSGVHLSDGSILHAGSTFVAAGKHNVRGVRRDSAARDPFVGLRLTLDPEAPLLHALSGVIELHLFEKGYAGLVLNEDGRVNACLAVRKSRLTQAGGDPAALLRQLADEQPLLAERLAYSRSLGRIDAVAAVPYGWRATETVPGRFLLGDQAACIPSFAGEGIGIALLSGSLAARHWLAQGAAGAPQYQAALARSVRRPVMIASQLASTVEHPAGGRVLARTAGAMPWLGRLLAQATRVRT